MPPTFAETLAVARSTTVWHWLEIEGLPWAYGNFPDDGGLFAGRAAGQRREGIRALSVKVPAGLEQKVDVLAGTASIGQLRMEILDLSTGDLAMELGLAVGRADNLLSLIESVEDDGDELVVPESSLVGAYAALPGVLYLDRETIEYAALAFEGGRGWVFSGLSRGRYTSRAAAHPAGALLSLYPRFLMGRDARVLYFLGDAQPEDLDDEAVAVARLVGLVGPVAQTRECTGYEITLESVDRKVSGWLGTDERKKRTLFGAPWRATLRLGMPSRARSGRPATKDEDEQEFTVDGTGALDDFAIEIERPVNPSDPATRIAYTGSLAKFNFDRGRGFTFFVRIDEEVLLLEAPDFLATFLPVVKRGCFGTRPAQHDTGAEVIEVMPIAWASDTTSADVETYALPWRGDHPIEVALQLITSTGTGANGAWDKLPKRWGMGVPVEYLDLDEILRTRDRAVPALRVAGIVTDPIDLRAWLAEQLYAPFGLFPVAKMGGLYSIRQLRAPLPLDPVVDVTSRHLVEPPGWDANADAVIGSVVFDLNFNALTGKAESVGASQDIFAESQRLYPGQFGEIHYTSKLIREGAVRGGLSFPLDPFGGGQALAEARAGFFERWFARPPPAIPLDVSWDLVTAEPGDVLSLTATMTPDSETGALGLEEKKLVVTSKKPDDRAGRVRLETLAMGIRAQQLRHVAPAARVVSWTAGSLLLVVQAAEFAVEGSTGLTLDDVELFRVGFRVRVHSPDEDVYSGFVTISAAAGGSLTLSAIPTGRTPQPDDILVFADYDDANGDQRDAFAFMADEERRLGAGDAPAHEHLND